MSTYKTVRGKLVTLGRIHLAVHDNGDLQIHVGEQGMLVPEADAGALHDLMSDVLEWTSNAGTTEAKFDKMAERDEDDLESGKLMHEAKL